MVVAVRDESPGTNQNAFTDADADGSGNSRAGDSSVATYTDSGSRQKRLDDDRTSRFKAITICRGVKRHVVAQHQRAWRLQP